jgi:hypothetical protein
MLSGIVCVVENSAGKSTDLGVGYEFENVKCTSARRLAHVHEVSAPLFPKHSTGTAS